MRIVQATILGVGLATAGCVAHTTEPGSRDQMGSVGSRPPNTSLFAYDRVEVRYKNAVLDELETRNYRVRRIQFPSIGDNGQRDDLVTGYYYESKHSGEKPLVIVLPLWGGHLYPSKRMTGYLRRHSDGDVHVFRMLGERTLTDWHRLKLTADEEAFMALWHQTVERQRNTVVDIRRTIDWALARPEIDGDRIALVAFSRAALMGALVAAFDDRLAATALVMGGAHPHVALAQCPMLRGKGAQSKVRKEFGWTLDEFTHRLEPIYRDLDPARYPDQADPRKILLVEAGDDECFPSDAREALYTVLGQPERIVIADGHKMSFLSMTPLGGSWLQERIWEFFQRSF